MTHRYIILLLTFLLPTFALAPIHSAYGLSTDRDQPAEIEADDIEFDFRTGTRTYIDNVKISQGTLRIIADKLIANYQDSDLEKATAWGEQARFSQRPDGKPDDVQGWANKIIVNQKANTLTLLGKAALKQGKDVARGETIIYNMANDTLKVKGAAKIGSGKKPAPTAKAASADNKQLADSGTPEPTPLAEKPPEEPSSPVSTAPSGRSRLIIQPK